MNQYRFALLRYLMGSINAVSPSAQIHNNHIDDASCRTCRDVYGSLDILALFSKLKDDGWNCTMVGGSKLEATAIRNNLDCQLVVDLKSFDSIPFFFIGTWAYNQ